MDTVVTVVGALLAGVEVVPIPADAGPGAVSYTHLRAHETVLDLVCRLLLAKNNQSTSECK